jgi:hypothetical protein
MPRAARVVDVEGDRVADFQRAPVKHTIMKEEAVQLLLRVLDLEGYVAANREGAAVADLAAGFCVEGRLIDENDAALALA